MHQEISLREMKRTLLTHIEPLLVNKWVTVNAQGNMFYSRLSSTVNWKLVTVSTRSRACVGLCEIQWSYRNSPCWDHNTKFPVSFEVVRIGSCIILGGSILSARRKNWLSTWEIPNSNSQKGKANWVRHNRLFSLFTFSRIGWRFSQNFAD